MPTTLIDVLLRIHKEIQQYRKILFAELGPGNSELANKLFGSEYRVFDADDGPDQVEAFANLLKTATSNPPGAIEPLLHALKMLNRLRTCWDTAVAYLSSLDERLTDEALRLHCVVAEGLARLNAKNCKNALVEKLDALFPDSAHPLPELHDFRGPNERSPARHSSDFRCVHWFGKHYSFSENQAKIVSLLWLCWENGPPYVSDHSLVSEDGPSARQIRLVSKYRFLDEIIPTPGTRRLTLLFKGHPAWGEMIVRGNRFRNTRMLIPPHCDLPCAGKCTWTYHLSD